MNRSRQDHYLHQNYAEFLESTGDLTEAVEQWRQIQQLLPHHPIAFYQAGRLLVRLGKYREAEQSLSEALRLRNSFPEATVNLETRSPSRESPTRPSDTTRKRFGPTRRTRRCTFRWPMPSRPRANARKPSSIFVKQFVNAPPIGGAIPSGCRAGGAREAPGGGGAIRRGCPAPSGFRPGPSESRRGHGSPGTLRRGSGEILRNLEARSQEQFSAKNTWTRFSRSKASRPSLEVGLSQRFDWEPRINTTSHECPRNPAS